MSKIDHCVDFILDSREVKEINITYLIVLNINIYVNKTHYKHFKCSHSLSDNR